MRSTYKISTIIPVYNVELYLEKTIKSVINQEIGFQNIQLILVNDGSEDDSESICLKYKEKYPDNVIYVSKENEGVSIARNTGLKFAKGKYINFLDSDDYIDADFYKKAYKMLEENEQIDLVAARLRYFEASNRYHWLDYKFTGDRIIDIINEPESIILHIATALIRAEAMAGLEFDARLEISEDTKLLYEIILKKEKYGILSSSKYYYRRRKDKSSTIQTSRHNKTWYMNTIQYCHKFLVDLSVKKYGKVIPYVQYFLMYDMQWRIRTAVSEELTDEEKHIYIESIRHELKLIDDDIILFQKQMNNNYKRIALGVKYDGIKPYLTYKDEGIYIKELLLISYDELINNIELFHVENGKLIIEGNAVLGGILGGLQLYYSINGRSPVLVQTYERKPVISIFEEKYNVAREGYILELPLQDVRQIEFLVKAQSGYHILNNRFTHFSKSNNFKAGYYYSKPYLFTKGDKKINVKYKPFKAKVLFREIYFEAYILLKRKQYKVFAQRLAYWLTKPFMPKKIWLFTDREFMGRDSGELLFRYTNNQKNGPNRNTYFVINKNYEDYKRMGQYGKVTSYKTMKYRLLFLNARYIISSQADGYINNAFGKARKYYVDLFNFQYIYLTHGVLLHDSSNWLNRVNKDITLNVVTSPLEYKSILDGMYYFRPEQLIKTGLPRHDNLIKDDVTEENKILIMASWRSSLVGPTIKGTQRNAYNPEFKQSEYYQFYDRLFNDEKLHEKLDKYNYKIKFCIHPSLRAQFDDFEGNKFVEIAIDVDSQYEAKSSKMLITDYSSAACDFAYLRKPVVYANFDFEHIYKIHYYNKGYFDYDINGFGPNCRTYEETIREIIKCIENNCIMEDKYKKRCEEFFYYHDGNNCQRVYEAIVEHDNSRTCVK